ncbi:MAG: hypothetical protein BGO51_01340 [Rhodospirillales bacterium 69-11]|jgi:hypothetical protein|nr:hypothetical protein [Rhodospirillales bacterium]MBN8927754.1 hypothetical protein [Rhodospirillales bacterium]OJW25645.1 MAG: hypothetical protein BGO51_01340 [Rhodospirillales bacterium 69-11]
MCVLCGPATSGTGIATRDQALALLARLERPGTLPAAEAVHLAMRLLAWSECDAPRLHCDGVEPPAPADRRPAGAHAA